VTGPRAVLPIALTVGLLATTWTAEAQQPPPTAKVARLGYLVGGAPGDPLPTADAFRQGLRDLGYVESRHYTIEFRYAENRIDRFPGLAAELVRVPVDLMVAPGTAAAVAARKASATLPIVLVLAGNPIGDGLIQSFARPGGNATGLTMSVGPEIASKFLELLKEVVPGTSRVSVLSNPLTAPHAGMLKEMEAAARVFGLALHSVSARRPDEIDGAFAAMSRARAQGLIVLADPMFDSPRVGARIRDLAAKSRLPALYGIREHPEAGGLMSYGPNLGDLHRRAAGYVDRILRGAKPADLPVERPSKFDLVVNQNTARALGLTIPASVLARADQVTE
jgi:putative ABC transport system substrate-binding protein